MPARFFSVFFSACILPLACRDTLPRDTLPVIQWPRFRIDLARAHSFCMQCLNNQDSEMVRAWGNCNQGLHAELLTYSNEALQ